MVHLAIYGKEETNRSFIDYEIVLSAFQDVGASKGSTRSREANSCPLPRCGATLLHDGYKPQCLRVIAIANLLQVARNARYGVCQNSRIESLLYMLQLSASVVAEHGKPNPQQTDDLFFFPVVDMHCQVERLCSF